MKQRYFISRDEKARELTIEEYAVVAGNMKRHEISMLAKDDFTLLCIESYEDKTIKKAISKGKDALVDCSPRLAVDFIWRLGVWISGKYN